MILKFLRTVDKAVFTVEIKDRRKKYLTGKIEVPGRAPTARTFHIDWLRADNMWLEVVSDDPGKKVSTPSE